MQYQKELFVKNLNVVMCVRNFNSLFAASVDDCCIHLVLCIDKVTAVEPYGNLDVDCITESVKVNARSWILKNNRSFSRN